MLSRIKKGLTWAVSAFMEGFWEGYRPEREWLNQTVVEPEGKKTPVLWN